MCNLKLEWPLPAAEVGSVFYPQHLRLSSFLFPISQKDFFSGACGCCWGNMWSVSAIFLYFLAEVARMPSPQICPAPCRGLYLWPGKSTERRNSSWPTCALRSRFSPQLGVAIVSWAPKLLYWGTESPLTPKHHGTISHSNRSLQVPPRSYLGLPDTRILHPSVFFLFSFWRNLLKFFMYFNSYR